MKLNKSKNKGKVHPSPSSSSSSSTTAHNNSASPISLSSSSDTLSTLNNLLPAAILTLISILSLQDKEVLAYMITHSLSSTTTATSSFPTPLNKNGKKPCSKKATAATTTTGTNSRTHKVPFFDCGCFDCYTSYWFRWDSSPNRELIHQAIEAFEEHLATCEQQKKSSSCNKSSKRKLKKIAAIDGSTPANTALPPPPPPPAEVVQPEEEEGSLEILPEETVGPSGNGESSEGGEVAEASGAQQKQAQQQSSSPQQQQHKGLARKVLPDVIGLFNSRLWNFWGPNV